MGVWRARPVALHVLTRLILGGATRPVLDSCCLLAGLGYRPVLVVGSAAREDVPRDDLLARYPDLPVLQVASLVRQPAPLRDARALAVLAAATRRLQPAVLHTHTAKAGTLGRLAGRCARHRGVKLVHTFHGHSLSRASSGGFAPVWTGVEKLLAARATDLVLTLSPGQAEEIGRRLGPRARERIAVLPLGVPLTGQPGLAEVSQRLRERRKPGERLIGFVGRGAPAKGLEDLAVAHARLAARRSDLAGRLGVVIVGPMQAEVESRTREVLRRAGLEPRWHWLGPILDAGSLMRELDALVLPSRSEGTPVSVIEALGQGLPVIASRVGGVGELLGCDWERRAPGVWRTTECPPRGLLLPAQAPDAWARALEDLVEGARIVPGDPDERCRFARSVFDPARHAYDLVSLYRGGSGEQRSYRGGAGAAKLEDGAHERAARRSSAQARTEL